MYTECWLFPALIKVHNNSKNFSIVPAVFSWMVTITHAYLNARWFSHHGKHFTKRWLKDARFVIGCSLYYIGLVVIIWHDTIQRDLRPCLVMNDIASREMGYFTMYHALNISQNLFAGVVLRSCRGGQTGCLYCV